MGRKLKDTIYKRGKEYWLQYYVEGQRIRESLGTTKLRETKRLCDCIMLPLITAKDVKKRPAIFYRLNDAETELKRLLVNRKKLRIEESWNQYL